MKRNSIVIASVFSILLSAGIAPAANIVIVNGDVAGEGLNDPTVVAPVGNNPGATLGEQRMNVLVGVGDIWGAIIESSVDIRIFAKFDPINMPTPCSVIGSTGPGTVYMNFPGAPVANTWFHSVIADSITGVDQNPGGYDFLIIYNSNIDDPGVCAQPGFYYGMDENLPVNSTDLFPVVLHEEGHGLGFASFVNPTNGVQWGGVPDIFGHFSLDMTTGLHWPEMTNAQRVASATNDGNLVWDGPNSVARAPDTYNAGAVDLEMTAPPAVAGTYDALGAAFGKAHPPMFGGDLELVQAISGTPSEGCDTLAGFTPGNIAFIDRGNCEFGVKALNAENAGASGVVVANNSGGTLLITLVGGTDGHLVTIPVVLIGQDDGNLIRPELPGVTTLTTLEWPGLHIAGFPQLYAPTTVAQGSSVSHWDDISVPDLLMEPFTSIYIRYNEVDLTPAQLKDVGHTIAGFDEVFADGFETGDTTNWDTTSP